MTHDPMCACTPTGFDIALRARDEFCLCDLIAKVRADVDDMKRSARVDLSDVALLKLEPGATYVIEVNVDLTPDEAAGLRAKLHDLTGANFVVVSQNVRIVRADTANVIKPVDGVTEDEITDFLKLL